MSLWLTRPRLGDHVKARRDISAGFVDSLTGQPTIKKGRRGIIRDVQPGWMRDRYVVEFSDGYLPKTIRDVRGSDIRSLLVGHGEQQWQWRRDLHVGARFGLFALFTLPGLVAIGLYFLHGGTPAGLLSAIVNAFASLLVDAVSFVGPTVVIVVILVVLFIRSRKR